MKVGEPVILPLLTEGDLNAREQTHVHYVLNELSEIGEPLNLPLLTKGDLITREDGKLMYRMYSLNSKRLVSRSHPTIEEGFKQKRRQSSSLLLGGQNVFNSLPH